MLSRWQEGSRGRSKLNDLHRANIRDGGDTGPDQDTRLVTCERSSSV